MDVIGVVGVALVIFLVVALAVRCKTPAPSPSEPSADLMMETFRKAPALAWERLNKRLEEELERGREEARVDRMRASTGVRYVPYGPLRPLVRLIREPLLDTFRIPEGTGPFTDLSLFVDNKKFPDGRAKVHGIDTNMLQPGLLGTPYEADLICWSVRFDGDVSGPDMLKVLANLRLRLLIGNREPDDPKYIASQVSGPELYPVLILTDGRTHEAMGPPVLRDMIGKLSEDKYERFMAKLEFYLRAFGESGLWRNWGRGLAVERARPYHLDSTTAFRVQADYWGPPLSRQVTVRVILRANKYVPIP